MNRIDKFYEIKNLMQCPRCGKKMRFHAGGLVCKREHRFDISSKGYVNLLQETKALKGYDAEFFAARSSFLAAGYYEHIMGAVIEKTAELAQTAETTFAVIDAGCGEGYYSVNLARRPEAIQVLAFDISADAVKIAARNPENVKWMVADITNIPVKDYAVDCILDVFTPANYKEFARVLKPGGTVIKVVPGAGHLRQLREAVSDLLRSKAYSNEDVLDHFAQHFELTDRKPVSRTMDISAADLADLVRMTPLLFDVDKSRLDLSGLKEITVEAEVLTGKVK